MAVIVLWLALAFILGQLVASVVILRCAGRIVRALVEQIGDELDAVRRPNT